MTETFQSTVLLYCFICILTKIILKIMSSVPKAHPQLAAKAHPPPPGALWEHLSPLNMSLS